MSPDERPEEENQPDTPEQAEYAVDKAKPERDPDEGAFPWMRAATRQLREGIEFPKSQNVIDPEGRPRKVVPEPSETEEGTRRPVVRVEYPSRQARFFSLTESEIETYAQFGFLSSIALTFFGTFTGFVLGCLVALIQGNLSEASTSVLKWLIGVGAIVAVI